MTNKSVKCQDCGILIEGIPSSMSKEKALSEHRMLDCPKGKTMQQIINRKKE